MRLRDLNYGQLFFGHDFDKLQEKSTKTVMFYKNVCIMSGLLTGAKCIGEPLGKK